jgi:hypothetical protein
MKIQSGKKTGRLRCVMTWLLSIIVLVSLIAVIGCTKKEAKTTKEVTTTPEITPHYSTFTDEAGLFSISYPPDWETALFLLPDTEAAAKDIITAIESDMPVGNVYTIFLAGIPKDNGYFPYMNMVVESIPEVEWTHDKVVEAGIAGITQLVPDYYLFSQVKTTVDGREATILDWEGTISEDSKTHVLQMMVLVGKTAWFVTCTPPLEEFSKWEEDFQAIVRSLRILK